MDVSKLSNRLQKIYPKNYKTALADILYLIEKWEKFKFSSYNAYDQSDIFLITYGDAIKEKNMTPLRALEKFLRKHPKDLINNIHILPMYPYTSDDGFSVVDYRKIDPLLGTWDDIWNLKQHYHLMFDAVVNHASKESIYFKGFLQGKEAYRDYFTTYDENFDYSKVVRPRTSPLFHSYQASDQVVKIWTTFSEDQVDFNFSNTNVLIEILDILLFYVHNGARFIRLDAIGFLWKSSGTTCMHLEETHEVVKLMRDVIHLFTNAELITETNVPHLENISYFGQGDEAAMVYQFPLPPLVMFTMLNQNASHLNQWLASLIKPNNGTTFFNFLASHDGIGMRPVENILSEKEKNMMASHVESIGGRINYKSMPDGTKVPYELNINYMDAITMTNDSDEIRAKKFIAAQTILLSVIGVPAIYYHSLLGSRSDFEGMKKSGINRRINREKLILNEIDQALGDTKTLRYRIFNQYLKLINIRKKQSAFHPDSLQIFKSFNEQIVSFERVSEKQRLLVLINVSSHEQLCQINQNGYDLISNSNVNQQVHLSPYQAMWIELKD